MIERRTKAGVSLASLVMMTALRLSGFLAEKFAIGSVFPCVPVVIAETFSGRATKDTSFVEEFLRNVAEEQADSLLLTFLSGGRLVGDEDGEVGLGLEEDFSSDVTRATLGVISLHDEENETASEAFEESGRDVFEFSTTLKGRGVEHRIGEADDRTLRSSRRKWKSRLTTQGLSSIRRARSTAVTCLSELRTPSSTLDQIEPLISAARAIAFIKASSAC